MVLLLPQAKQLIFYRKQYSELNGTKTKGICVVVVVVGVQSFIVLFTRQSRKLNTEFMMMNNKQIQYLFI